MEAVRTEEKKAIRGGEVLIRESKPNEIFTPEEWSEEHKMIAQTCRDFLATEIEPNLDRIDDMEEGLMRSVMEKVGELGLLGVRVPEEYMGLGLDFNSSMLAAEALGAGRKRHV